jgi:hypothetical protein
MPDFSFLAGSAPVPLLSPIEIEARRAELHNALAAGTLRDQQISQNALQFDQTRRAIADQEEFKRRFGAASLSPSSVGGSLPPGSPPSTAGGGAGNPPTPGAAYATPGDSVLSALGAPAAPAAPAGVVPPSAAAPAAQQPAEPTDADFLKAFGTAGYGYIEAREKARKMHADYLEQSGKAAVAQRDYFGVTMAGLQTVNFDPTAVQDALRQAAADGYGPQAAQMAQQIQQNPAILPTLAKQAIGGSKAAQELLQSRAAANASNASAAKTNEDTRGAAMANDSQFVTRATNREQYRTLYNSLPPERRAGLPLPDDWTAATRGQLLKQGQTANQQITSDQAAETLAQTKTRDTDTANWHRGELAARNAEIGLNRQKVSFDQGAIQRAGEALGRGELTRLKDIASLRGDQRLQIYDIAKQTAAAAGRTFSVSEVDRQIRNEDYYANGKGADSLRSFNTFLEHAGAASDAVNQIRLSAVPVINKPLNWWREHLSGSPELQQLVGSLEPVRKEFEGYLLGGHALHTDDRKAAETILSDNSSPAQIQQALKTMGHTAVARAREENYRYKKLAKHDLQDAFSPEAIEGARKIGTELGFGDASAPRDNAQPAQNAAPAAAGLQHLSTDELLKQLAK